MSLSVLWWNQTIFRQVLNVLVGLLSFKIAMTKYLIQVHEE